MIITHRGKRPSIDQSAVIAPTAVICGDVTVGPESCVAFGAVITAEGAPVVIGSRSIVRENAVLRGVTGHSLQVGDNVLIGPGSALSGCTVEDEVFLATRVTVFHDAVVKKRAEVRVNGIVHVRTVLPENAVVPIGWIAVGDPARILPPVEHDEIWSTLKPLNFPQVAYGVPRRSNDGSEMRRITEVVSKSLAQHRGDEVV